MTSLLGQISIVGASIFGSLFAALLAMAPVADRIVAIFPPWWSAAQAFQAAASAGHPTRIGWAPTIIVVEGERSTLAARLQSGGALILLDSRGSWMCGDNEGP